MDLTGIQKALPDHEVRPVVLADVPMLLALVDRITIHVLGESDANEAEIRDDLTGAHFDLATDTFVAVSPAGQATAYGQGHDEHSGAGWVDVYADPSLAPQLFDAVADAAISACVSRIIESVVARGAAEVKLTSNLYESETAMRWAYERAGFAVETVYWRMVLNFVPGSTLEKPALPSDYSITRLDPDDDEVMELGYRLFRDTFSEHHGIGDSNVSLADYAKNWREAESYDPRAWWFAFNGTEPVGLLLGDNRRREQGYGYVRSVGVIKEQRGKGIARALLLTAFEHWRGTGCSGVQLGVDTANVTGATRLYESVGMTSLHSALALARDVTV